MVLGPRWGGALLLGLLQCGCVGALTDWGTLPPPNPDGGIADSGSDVDAGGDEDAGLDAGIEHDGGVDGGTDAGAEDGGFDAGPCEQPEETRCHGTCVNLLYSEENCGGCGITCSANPPSFAQCTEGRCLVTLVSGRRSPDALAVDSSYVYWADNDGAGNNVAAKVPINGGHPITLATGLNRPSLIAVDTHSLYWTATYEHQIVKTSLEGGEPITLETVADNTHGVATNGSDLYFASERMIARTTVDGGAITTLAHDYGTPVAAFAWDGSVLLWGANSPSASVYWVPVTGGQPQLVASGQQKVSGVALDNESFYWGEDYTGIVKKRSRTTGIVSTLATGRSNPVSFAVDDEWLYWVEWQGTNNVVKIPKRGGTPVTLATFQPLYCNQIAIDDTSVYWTAGTAVMKLTPK